MYVDLLGKRIAGHGHPDIFAKLISCGIIVGQIDMEDHQSSHKSETEEAQQSYHNIDCEISSFLPNTHVGYGVNDLN